MTVEPVVRAGMRRPHWITLGLAVLALLGAGVGTFASFSASTTNNSSFATGALILSNRVNNEVTACFSTIGGNTDVNANDCTALYDVTVRSPGDTAQADVDIKNEANLDGIFGAYGTCTDTDAVATGFHGDGNPCSALQLTVQEYASAAARTSENVTGGNCRFGASTGADVACAFGPTLGSFVGTHGAFGSALALGTIIQDQTRWFRVRVKMPSTAGNTLQGRRATFGLTWRAVQS